MGLIVFLDLAGTFSFSDIPFIVVFVLYFIFRLIQNSPSKVSFVITIYFLMAMGLSYIKTGPGSITERMGEWFYLFFIVGLIQYLREIKKNEKAI